MNEAEKNGLIEEFMPEVEEIAREMDDGTLPLEDLIQEGYVGLLEGIAELAASRPDSDEMEYLGFAETDALPTEDVILGAVRNAIRKAEEGALAANRTNDSLVVQVDLLNQSIERLTEELGVKPNIDEIANDLKIPQDKVLDIIKLTGEDVDADDAAANQPKRDPDSRDTDIPQAEEKQDL